MSLKAWLVVSKACPGEAISLILTSHRLDGVQDSSVESISKDTGADDGARHQQVRSHMLRHLDIVIIEELQHDGGGLEKLEKERRWDVSRPKNRRA